MFWLQKSKHQLGVGGTSGLNPCVMRPSFMFLGTSFCVLGECVCRPVLKTRLSSPF